MKLHLGCGQLYLDGYINIDFPLTAHSVQRTSVADIQTDISSLRYSPETIEEVRLHHVFEHFTRPVACALLSGWFSWLKRGGIIRLEVPDFQKTARVMLSPFASLKRRSIAQRHLFGSHEATWAVHCEGYTPRGLNYMVEQYGFKVQKISRNAWKGTYNFELIARKSDRMLTKEDFRCITEEYLRNFLVDKSDSECKLLSVWMDIYQKQADKS